MKNIYKSVAELIGSTPLLELVNFGAAGGAGAKILAKLEYFNPAGSVKDRIAKAMIDDAEPVSYTHLDVYKRQEYTVRFV